MKIFRPTLLAAALVVLAVALAYRNALGGAFVGDDLINLTANPTIRDLADLRAVFSPPANAGVGGRPGLNFSFALNHALGGLQPRGYHLANVAIHALAALALLGLVRRLLLSPTLRARFGAEALPLATIVAVVWAVHPLATGAVTYVSQRAESLMALFYLLTLYCATRAIEAENSARWQRLALLACALGMATKQVMATAPLLTLLLDRTFFAGTFAAALRARPRFYAMLALTWGLLAALLLAAGPRGVGYGLGVTWHGYALNELFAVARYLGLALWPQPLVWDYGAESVQNFAAVAPQAGLLAVLLVLTLIALCRRSAAGFAGAWFFLILAPTSTVIPVALAPVAESRAYLPLAGLVALAVLALHAWLGRRVRLAWLVAALVLTALTLARNRDYASEISLWADTVEKRPANLRARANLGTALFEAGRTPEAAAQWEAALRLDPAHARGRRALPRARACRSRRCRVARQSRRAPPQPQPAARGRAPAPRRAAPQRGRRLRAPQPRQRPPRRAPPHRGRRALRDRAPPAPRLRRVAQKPRARPPRCRQPVAPTVIARSPQGDAAIRLDSAGWPRRPARSGLLAMTGKTRRAAPAH